MKLNTNEAPLGPSPAVAPAIAAAAAGLRLYPDPDGEPLRSRLAEHHGVGPDSILVANGADQVLDCCFRAFCEPGDAAVWPVPTYSLFPVLARVFGAVPVEVPLDPDARLPAALGFEPGVLRFAVNPNSPTGVWMEPDQLERLLGGAPGVVVVDEAYCDFAPRSCVPVLPRHPDWLVVRTFSKSHALAGLRVGYAVGDPSLIAALRAVKDSYPVDRCAIAGAAAALADAGHHARLVEAVRTERARLVAGLETRGWSVLPSHANFILARPPGGDAAAVATLLRAARVLVRHFPGGPFGDRLRITVGTPDDTAALLAALDTP